MKTFFLAAVSLLTVCSLVGCGSGSPSTVTGKVLLDGQPLSGAQVQLLPKGNASGGMHAATTDAEGKFTIVEDGSSNNPVQPGSYVVLVSKITGGMGDAVNEVPDLYQDRKHSPLTVEIKTAETQLPPLELKKATPKS